MKPLSEAALQIAEETTVAAVEAAHPDFLQRGCWLFIKRAMQDGDKICYLQNLRSVGGRASGYQSIALLRGDTIVAECMTAVVG